VRHIDGKESMVRFKLDLLPNRIICRVPIMIEIALNGKVMKRTSSCTRKSVSEFLLKERAKNLFGSQTNKRYRAAVIVMAFDEVH
jgi:cobalamin-dependent methionine synthase I